MKHPGRAGGLACAHMFKFPFSPEQRSSMGHPQAVAPLGGTPAESSGRDRNPSSRSDGGAWWRLSESGSRRAGSRATLIRSCTSGASGRAAQVGVAGRPQQDGRAHSANDLRRARPFGTPNRHGTAARSSHTESTPGHVTPRATAARSVANPDGSCRTATNSSVPKSTPTCI